MKPFSFPVFRLWLSAVLVLAALAMPARLVYGGPSKPSPASASGSIAAGRLLVKFREEATAETTDGVFVASGLAVQRHLEGLNVYVVGVPEGEEMSFAEQLGRQSAIAYAEPDYIMEASGVPNDPRYATEQWNLPHVNAPTAWDITTGVSDVMIAILDTGVDLSHPDLTSKIVEGYDFVNGDAMPQDDNGHGTAVAGVAAAVTDNAEGVAGVAWGARIMPVKVLDSSGWGYYSGVADGIRWAADHGAQIIELGLGGYDPSSTLEDAVNYAYERGVLIVAAAGNDYLQGNRTFYPAAYPHVLAVTATNDTDEHARYSNTGAYIDIAAPGGDPEDSGDANPRHWITSTLWDGGSTYGSRAGTSMASAHIAGAAALVWSLHPSWTNDQVEGVIEATALDRGAPGRDDMFGWGRIDMVAAVAADAPPTCLADSSHPYSNNLDQTWAITNTVTDAAISRVHFSRLEIESGYDFANVKDGNGNTIQSFSSSYAGGVWSAPVPGRTVQIQLVSDYSVSAWGFCVDQIETVAYAPDIDVPGAPISVRLGPSRTTDRALVIGNTGRGALDFSISVADATTPGSGIPESGMEAPATSEEASVSAAPFHLVHADGDILKASPSQASAPQGASVSPSGSWGLGAPLSGPRYRLAGVTDNRQRYFAIGGNDELNDLALNEVYDPVTDRWTALAPMPTARMNIQAASVGGMLYVPGGTVGSDYVIISVHEAYDIARDSWSTVAPLPQPLAGAIVASAGDKVYAFGGASANGIEASTYQYDPGTDTWGTRSTMPTALAFGGAVEHGGHIYVMTGAATYYDLSPALLRYDPASDSWAVGPGLNTPRMSPAVITAGEFVYVIGGGGCGDFWAPCATVERYYLPAFPNGNWEVVSDIIPTPVVGSGYACAANKMWLGGGWAGSERVNLNQYLDEGLACGDAAWLSVDPTFGRVPADSSLSVTLTFAATDLEIGTYQANLIITSNDPDEAQVTVPVTIEVSATHSVYLPWIVK